MALAPGLVVAEVVPGSLAEEMEIEPGDRITRINGQDVMDLVDFRFLTSDDYLEIEVVKTDGQLWRLELDQDPQEEFGVQFASVSAQGIKHCHNKCLFCFVDQMPPKLRPTLYEKDDDYRLSLTQGSFVTLTNMSDEEFKRITSLHLSPLYVSVHATDPEVRRQLLKNPKAGKILDQLKLLARSGIIIHTQIVLVPDVNDGAVLERTIADLADLWPQVQSIAVVPVGLTAYREKLAPLKTFNTATARQVIEAGSRWQEKFRRKLGTTFLYFSDEFYVEAGLDFPPACYYDDFPQLENGVGLSRLFLDEVDSWFPVLPRRIARRRVHVVTGVSAGKTMFELINRICAVVEGLEVRLHVLENTFFGPSVTVAGLLTGADLLQGLKGVEGEVIIPRIMLKAGEELFLDDLTVSQVAERLGIKLIIADLDGQDFLTKLLGQSVKSGEKR